MICEVHETLANEHYAVRWRDAAHRPSGPREMLREGVRHVALTLLGSVAPARQARFLRCLYCHYVFDDQREKFERILEALQAIGTFVDTNAAIDMLKGEREIDGRYFHLSFDDGFRNIAANASPILERLAIPAIAFVPSALMGGDYRSDRDYCMGTMHYRGVVETCSWDDIRVLIDRGVEIGSHTRTHIRMSATSKAHPERLLSEIVGSKQDIERQLKIECRYISWPYGSLRDFDDASQELIEKAGYRACFGAFRGTVVPHESPLFRIPRHHFAVQWPLSHIRLFANGYLEE